MHAAIVSIKVDGGNFHKQIPCTTTATCFGALWHADKILVNGPDAHPLYKYLKAAQPVAVPGSQATRPWGGEVAWNYGA